MKFKHDQHHKIEEPKDQDMYFTEDSFFEDPTVPKYCAGKTYKIPGREVDRWLMRGAMIVGDKAYQHTPLDADLARQHREMVEAEQKEAKLEAPGEKKLDEGEAEKAKAKADAKRALEAEAEAARVEAANAKASAAEKAKADAEADKKKPAKK